MKSSARLTQLGHKLRSASVHSLLQRESPRRGRELRLYLRKLEAELKLVGFVYAPLASHSLVRCTSCCRTGFRGIRQCSLHFLVLPLTGCGIPSELLNLSEFSFIIFKMDTAHLSEREPGDELR